MARLLIVDDEEGIRSLLTTFLTRAGYTVLEAADGKEAVSIFEDRADDIDCAIVDMSMPQMDGLETCQKMREINADCPLFVCSGMVDDRVRQFCDESGGAPIDFISKPFQFRDLVAKIKDCIG